MKKLLLSTLLLCTLGLFAQEQKEQKVSQMFFEAKVCELAKQLNFTESQKAKFIPIYRRYNEEMKNIWRKTQKPKKIENSEEAAKYVKQKIIKQQQAQEVCIKYIDEFAAILDQQQIIRLYYVEGQIQRKLMQRHKHGKSNQPKENKN